MPVPAMMGGGAPPGGMPSPMAPSPAGAPGQPPGGTGGASMPTPMAGAGASSMTKLKTGLEMIQSALVGLPMGSEIHTAVLKALGDIGKHMDKGADDNSQIVQQLAMLARQKQQQPPPTAAGPPQGAAPPEAMAA